MLHLPRTIVEHAMMKAGNKGAEAAMVAIEMANLLRTLEA